MSRLEELLQVCAARHEHLCPRQVLGVRMGLLGAARLGIAAPQRDKRLIALLEIDGCAADGIAVATGCCVGRRTMFLFDFGKLAATLVDTKTGTALRVTPAPGARDRAWLYVPEATARWQAQLLGYQRMPDDDLLLVQEVSLCFSLQGLLSEHGHRVACDLCGEEIINEREVCRDGVVLCRACAGQRYYEPAGGGLPLQLPGVMLWNQLR